MFDFDKQNKKGAPKGWGLKRIVGGLADAITMGTTDFDIRGSGILQYDGFMGRKTKRSSSTEMSEYYPIDHPRANNYAEIQEYYKNNPEVDKGGTWTKIGDQFVLLTPEQVKDRKDKLVKAAESGSKYAESLLEFDDPSYAQGGMEDIISNNTQSKASGLDTHPSYAQGGMVVVDNTTTYIQPIEV